MSQSKTIWKNELWIRSRGNDLFCNEWERPKAATAHLGDVRIPAANRFYEYYTTNPDFSDIEEEEGSEEMDESVENDYINASFSTADTSTIKGNPPWQPSILNRILRNTALI